MNEFLHVTLVRERGCIYPNSFQEKVDQNIKSAKQAHTQKKKQNNRCFGVQKKKKQCSLIKLKATCKNLGTFG